MAKITFTFEDTVEDGQTGVRMDINCDFDTQGENGQATPAMKVAGTLRRLWDTGALPAMIPLACPDLEPPEE